jgi:signal transduction histidine kinase
MRSPPLSVRMEIKPCRSVLCVALAWLELDRILNHGSGPAAASAARLATERTAPPLRESAPRGSAGSQTRAARVVRPFLESPRLALLIGFGGLLFIMAVAGVDAWRVLAQYRRSDSQIRSHYLAQNHALNDVRSDLYLSGTYVRDYLLEPNPSRAEAYRTSLEELRRHMDAALEAYGRQTNPNDAHYSALRGELTDYWTILAPIFHWNADERRRSGYAFLRDEVFLRRQRMLSVADQIAAINEQQLTAGNDQAALLLLRFQARLLVTLIAALVVGLGMALFSTRKILGLEQQSRLRYEEAARARSQLEDLSARLVQAQETERRALSRELHDEVGQSLSAVLVELRNLSAAQSNRPQTQPRKQIEAAHIETIKGLVENTVRVIRNMSLLLRPSMLDDLGLLPALKWQARECSKLTSMDVNVAAELDSDNLPDDYKTCIYRVVQEALHNCARHSQAKAIRIKVQQQPERLLLTIQDDGLGFDAQQTKGLGLLGIQERAARLGGVCDIHSAPGSGTIISVELPFQRDHRNPPNREIHSHTLS